MNQIESQNKEPIKSSAAGETAAAAGQEQGQQGVITAEAKSERKSLTAKQRIALILGSVAIVAVAAVVIALLLRPESVDVADGLIPTGAQTVTEENVTQIEMDIEEKVARGMFETYMNTTWNFPDGKSPSTNAIMGNSINNNYDFWFTVTLSSGEVVFTSGLIPLDSQIAEIVLDEELPAGTYAAVVNINMVDEKGEPVESNMGINVTLNIES